ncbi:hypothetical protein [Geodermatophilus chilensis]|uniref:hypothetical protein n=1 Tax=Geodermatophilus chilensis TaxID=2035835 RepID=UPI0012FFEB7D|nr:hypothetical protein [Geodermatophilus chilensis]
MTTELEHDTAVCAAATCTRPAGPGHSLCRPDAEKLGQWLAQLLDEVAMLDATPSMAGREPGTGGPGGLASQRSVGNLDVMVLRTPRRGTGRIAYDDADEWGLDATPSVLDTLGSYAALVRDARQLVRPTQALAYRRRAAPPGPVCDVDAPPCGHHTCEVWTFRAVVTPRLTVASERRVLADHLGWVLAQDWAGEFYDEMRALWGLLRAANGRPRPQGRARCRETVGGQPCGGTVRWDAGTATCGTCGASYTGLDVLRRHGAVA